MKLRLTLLLSLLLCYYSTTVAGVTCPKPNEENEESDTVLLPNPEDCATFYVCVHGKPTLLRCKGGLVFNPILKVSIFQYFLLQYQINLNIFCCLGLRLGSQCKLPGSEANLSKLNYDYFNSYY